MALACLAPGRGQRVGRGQPSGGRAGLAELGGRTACLYPWTARSGPPGPAVRMLSWDQMPDPKMRSGLHAAGSRAIPASVRRSRWPPLRDRVLLGAWTGVLMIRFTDGSKHRVECRAELGVPVPDQELQAVRVILEGHQQVACLLGYPLRGRPGARRG